MEPRRPQVSALRIGAVGLATVVLSGCRPDAPPSRVADSGAASQPADSVAVSRGPIEVWFTLARAAQASDGKPCLERGLEIRRGERRAQVPLLYTGESPILLSDTTMRAVLWNGCQPVDTYLVDLRSGRPVRERKGNPQ